MLWPDFNEKACNIVKTCILPMSKRLACSLNDWSVSQDLPTTNQLFPSYLQRLLKSSSH